MKSDPPAGVEATEAALEAIRRLEAAQGPLMFFQSGGCCDGTSPICLKAGELPIGPGDIRLAEIGGALHRRPPRLASQARKPSVVVR
jgi:uncharacterized protein